MANVDDIKVDDLPTIRDERGTLVVAEFSKQVPFSIARIFYIHGVAPNTSRGKHAHRLGRQYLICQSGHVLIDATDGKRTRQIRLMPGQAALIENGIFASEAYIDRDTVLLVLCDRPYDRSDYIESMEEFLQAHLPP